MENLRQKGTGKEQVAAEYLEANGYRILHRNYRSRFGEIDLVAKDGEYLCFVEVKYRDSDRHGFPEEAVHYAKQKKIIKAAGYYLMKEVGTVDCEMRFDVVAIIGGQIRLIKNAFEA